jgi:hypothetical protein
MNVYRGREGIAPLILDFGIGWMLWQTLHPGCFTYGEFSGYKPCITQYWVFSDRIVVAQPVETCFQDYDSVLHVHGSVYHQS